MRKLFNEKNFPTDEYFTIQAEFREFVKPFVRKHIYDKGIDHLDMITMMTDVVKLTSTHEHIRREYL